MLYFSLHEIQKRSRDITTDNLKGNSSGLSKPSVHNTSHTMCTRHIVPHTQLG